VQGKIQKAVAARDDAEVARLKVEREQVLKDLNALTGSRWIPHPTHNAREQHFLQYGGNVPFFVDKYP
jgi:hypothetical protein